MKNTNKEQCERLWREYEPQIRKICRVKLYKYQNEVDDTVSDVFLALCKKIEKSGVPENPKPWLYAVLNNIINQRLRDIYRQSECETEFDFENVCLPFEKCEIEEKIESVYNEEIQGKLKTILSEDEYQIIKYIYFNRLKLKEIAVLTGSTESAVKQKHYRMCNKLRKIIKNHDEIC